MMPSRLDRSLRTQLPRVAPRPVRSTARPARRQLINPQPASWTTTRTTGSALQEGRDYAFMAKVGGRPIHWSMTNTITIGFIKPPPGYVSDTLNLTIAHLRAHTRLNLSRAIGHMMPDIALELVKSLPSSGSHLTCLGSAGLRWNTQTGLIESATVAVVDRLPPDTLRTTLAHELAHALGVGHCTSTAELMAPVVVHNQWLGLGDLKALRLIGRRASRNTNTTPVTTGA